MTNGAKIIIETPLLSTKTIVTANGRRGNAPSTFTPDFDSLQNSDLRNNNNNGTAVGHFNNSLPYTPSSSNRRQNSFRIRQYRLAQPLRVRCFLF